MRVTIIKDDNAVNIDGVRRSVDLTELPAGLHVVQWDGARGEIEYKTITCDHCGTRSRKMNEPINDIAPYQKYVDAWNVADAEAKADEAAEEEARAHATGQKS